ncbi:MAG: hypothetical protein KAQ87_01950 [Candidatus Pacebacteria bacterium]|nr:hypothetical protein [Candidatus Paceibacterota bacterium]
MYEKEKTTPVQGENKHEKREWPVAPWFVAFLAITLTAAVFGPGVIGISEIITATDTGIGGTDTETDAVPVGTEEPETEEIGKTGIYYPVSNLPQEISSEKRPDMNLVNVGIENNILKFSIVKNDDERFNNVRYNSVRYRVKVIAYRGEPWNREIEYSFLSDRSDRLDCFDIGKQSQDIEGDFYLIERQSADPSSIALKETSCEIKKIWFYLE